MRLLIIIHRNNLLHPNETAGEIYIPLNIFPVVTSMLAKQNEAPADIFLTRSKIMLGDSAKCLNFSFGTSLNSGSRDFLPIWI